MRGCAEDLGREPGARVFVALCQRPGYSVQVKSSSSQLDS